MSLILSKSKPEVTIFCHLVKNQISITDTSESFESFDIPMDDLCYLIDYVLTNTDLYEADPRITLVEKIKKLKIIEGYNPGNTRFGEK